MDSIGFRKLISIHAPRVGSDRNCWPFLMSLYQFQSTLPVWGATTNLPLSDFFIGFQSTLPVWGATGRLFCCFILMFHFNPRSPCGERHAPPALFCVIFEFQSTLPVWGATMKTGFLILLRIFQSTLPVWGATANRNKKSLVSILNNIILYKIKQGSFLFLKKILLLICNLPSFFGANLPRIL